MTRPTALVTGAGVRVGRAIALELAASGFSVAVHYNASAGPADEVVELVRARGGEAFAVQADLGGLDGVDALARAVASRWEGLNVLVHNASIFYPKPVEDIDQAEWDRMLGVNLKTPFFLTRALLPQLRAADGALVGAPPGQHGLVVHLCDIGADRPVSRHAHYSVSKAGLVMLVKALAVELGPAVRSVGVSPGQVAWPEGYDEALRDRITRRIPLRRVGAPEDVARLVRFLALEGHYLHGAVIPVDGGLSCRY